MTKKSKAGPRKPHSSHHAYNRDDRNYVISSDRALLYSLLGMSTSDMNKMDLYMGFRKGNSVTRLGDLSDNGYIERKITGSWNSGGKKQTAIITEKGRERLKETRFPRQFIIDLGKNNYDLLKKYQEISGITLPFSGNIEKEMKRSNNMNADIHAKSRKSYENLDKYGVDRDADSAILRNMRTSSDSFPGDSVETESDSMPPGYIMHEQSIASHGNSDPFENADGRLTSLVYGKEDEGRWGHGNRKSVLLTDRTGALTLPGKKLLGMLGSFEITRDIKELGKYSNSSIVDDGKTIPELSDSGRNLFEILKKASEINTQQSSVKTIKMSRRIPLDVEKVSSILPEDPLYTEMMNAEKK